MGVSRPLMGFGVFVMIRKQLLGVRARRADDGRGDVKPNLD